MIKGANNMIDDDDDEDDDEYIKKLKKSLNLIDNVIDNSDNDDDLNNYKLNNELVELANQEVSSTPLRSSKFVESGVEGVNKKINNFDDDYDDDCCLLPEFDWANLEAKLKEESKEREYSLQQVS